MGKLVYDGKVYRDRWRLLRKKEERERQKEMEWQRKNLRRIRTGGVDASGSWGLEAATAVSIVVSTVSATAAQKQDDPDCFTAAISTQERAVAISTSAAAAAQK